MAESIDRRTALRLGTAAVIAAGTGACTALPAIAGRYTVAQHVMDMEAAGAPFLIGSDGPFQIMRGIDWPAFREASDRAYAAGITPEDIDAHLRQRRKFTGDGWYAHKEPVGAPSFHWIAQVWSEMDQCPLYHTRAWPGLDPVPDRILTATEVDAFIHGPG